MSAPCSRTTVVLSCVALLASGVAGCSHAKPAATPDAANEAAFRGVYEMGPDRSAFFPCGSGEQWYVSVQSPSARELRRLTSTQDLQSPGGGMLPPERAPSIKRAYAEVRGDTVPATSSQLARAFERELRVTHVEAVRPAQGTMCP